jgi:hypothetical protein
LVALVLLWFLGLLGVMAWRTPMPPLGLVPIGITAVALGVLIVLEVQGRLRTQLHVDGQRLVLRGVFGVGQRVLTLPASVESGRRIERRPGPPGLSHENEAVDHDAGAYLRLTSAGVQLTILGERAPGLANHWQAEGWSRGPQRRAPRRTRVCRGAGAAHAPPRRPRAAHAEAREALARGAGATASRRSLR